ncbi:hypothetical protein OsJ_32364 [Oryza sativa Japonica Group]|uniref:Uncharacterized protein n=1 Tax=Oryza sativa subsp. japonica TaxID=39947 RepID=B9G6V8_ORYSJ|nr:hypothetical protein OsJ_32364 [Oryza sativa Japonica Group]
MEATVDELSEAYQEFVAAAAAVVEARGQSGGEKNAATDAALEAFKQRRRRRWSVSGRSRRRQGEMEATVDELSEAYQEFVAAAAAVVEARGQSGGEKNAATDAALEAFKQRWELFRVACDHAEELVESIRQRIGSECLVDEATGASSSSSGGAGRPRHQAHQRRPPRADEQGRPLARHRAPAGARRVPPPRVPAAGAAPRLRLPALRGSTATAGSTRASPRTAPSRYLFCSIILY